MESRGSVPARPATGNGGGSGARGGVWRFTVPTADASVPEARHAVRDLLGRQGLAIGDDVVQGLLLILTELVTNAVKHAALLSPEVAVEVAVGAGRIRVAVEDDHPYRPTALETDWRHTGGRGLLLVREIAREAGGAYDVEPTAGGGKVVWAELPLGAVRPGGGAPALPGPVPPPAPTSVTSRRPDPSAP
ncbi:ATP-binding protein [Streptomyces sp. NPDC020412]|uniref:ATP-binding protein n=1 Tax=Streptomyces sp. NPDC020412 TaxID=3365073 RepID=UPI00379DCE0B